MSLFQNSTLETVFRPFPGKARKTKNKEIEKKKSKDVRRVRAFPPKKKRKDGVESPLRVGNPKGQNLEKKPFLRSYTPHTTTQIKRHEIVPRVSTTLSFHFSTFLFYQGKKDYLLMPNPQNPWKRRRKYQNNQGNPLLKINQGNPQKPRKGKTG